jgi:hypothetical protein
LHHRIPNVALGSKADMAACPINVRYSPESGRSDVGFGPPDSCIAAIVPAAIAGTA